MERDGGVACGKLTGERGQGCKMVRLPRCIQRNAFDEQGGILDGN